MPKFGKTSLNRLSTCDMRLQTLFNKVVETYDCTIVQGFRNEVEQNIAFNTKKSKLKWPNSKHNKTPSIAVDVVPYINGKISWDVKECEKFGRYVLTVAKSLGIKIRWGGSWSSDPKAPLSKTFVDMPHFELM